MERRVFYKIDNSNVEDADTSLEEIHDLLEDDVAELVGGYTLEDAVCADK